MILEVEGLGKRFPLGRGGSAVVALEEIGFFLAPSEALGLVGESGCGKTTLARIIARLADPTSGSIRFAGEEIGTTPAARFARHRARGPFSWSSRMRRTA